MNMFPTSNVQTDLSSYSAAAMQAKAKAASQKNVDAVAEDFEAVFLTQMFQHMFAGIEANKEFGGGHAENVYRSLMLNEYGKQVAARGGIGIADQMKSTLLAQQEVTQ